MRWVSIEHAMDNREQVLVLDKKAVAVAVAMDKTPVAMEEAAAVPVKLATEAADNLHIFLFL